ncbi:MAG: glycosyltransferase [Candidatus Lokiarchaeota archaeon]|nr:glycosyltransferase [Candidatus Lokiarchaeota archaeon]
MKILMVSKLDEEVGGVASYTKTLIKNLKDNKADIRAIELEELFKIDGDIIHIQHEPLLYSLPISVLFPLIIVILKLIRRKPIILTFHGVMDLGEIRKFAFENKFYFPSILIRLTLFLMFRILIAFSNIVIVHTPSFKKNLISHYYSNVKKIRVIPHGIWKHNSVSKDVAKKKLGLENQKIIFTLGYLAKHKNIEGLIHAFKKIEGDNIKLIIGGEIPPRFVGDPNYEQYVSNLKSYANSNIIFPGYIPYKLLSLYFACSDFFIIPHKRRVSASGPLCRALGYGIPVIGAEQNVLKPYIPESNIFRDMEAAISAIKENKIDIERSTRWSKRLRKRFSWDNIAKLTLRVYEEVYNKSSR